MVDRGDQSNRVQPGVFRGAQGMSLDSPLQLGFGWRE